MPMRTESSVVAVFRDVSKARAAAGELTANAFAGDHIHIACENTGSNPHTDMPQDGYAGHREADVKRWFKSIFGRDDKSERHHYENVVRRGDVLLGIDTPEQMADTAADILHHHSPVDIHRSDAGASSEEARIACNTAAVGRE